MFAKPLAAAALLACVAGPVSAFPQTLTLDGGWQSFSFAQTGSAWDTEFTFTIVDPAYLVVTDAYISGDQFAFYANGELLGETSVPTALGESTSDFDVALASDVWSSGEAMLAAGSYTITGTTLASPYGSGGAAIQLSSTSFSAPSLDGGDAAVPIPATALLLVGAIGALGAAGRRRRAG
ncbi:VPLPA-CTERM sorting domain-containing protein [Albimonas sp. CAU 1670]|uniref:VPLPA-CTERM sorting domain-containing protein n=1 Tax=Albimonas sp. CAU 1670 TaxID=3032599 RepID=UPI0023DADC0B|nr:VPLPA-CTERM sorting domain-containing protein [Albimonas sp. CAU 1670]MDF2234049.1 VPLPA-CTERM sorting domain-containing protein [Albimonas sp. CAU 1670]